MATGFRYFDLIREMKSAFNHRLRLVNYARQHGIKQAARDFQTTLRTVRKWLRRYQAQGLKGLEELSRAPHYCPHKITGELAERVVDPPPPTPHLRRPASEARMGLALQPHGHPAHLA